MNNIQRALIIAGLFAVIPWKGLSAFESRSTQSLSAGVVFSIKETITHTPLTYVSQDTNQAVIAGNIEMNDNISAVTLIYYTLDLSTDAYVTETAVQIPLTASRFGAFTFTIPVNRLSSADYFCYRIKAEDITGKTVMYPEKSVVSIDVRPPLITHRKPQRISSVDRVLIATGTVWENTSSALDTLEVYYRTDNQVSFSTITVSMAQQQGNYYQFSFPITTQSGAQKFYYRFSATDKTGNISYLPAGGILFDIDVNNNYTALAGADGGRIGVPNGNPTAGETSLEMPAGSLDRPVSITVTEVDPTDPAALPSNAYAIGDERPVAVYKFSPDGLIFNKMPTMRLLYQDVNQDGIVDGTATPTEKLRVFWWDGYEWRLIGGTVDPVTHLVSVPIKHFSLYALFAANITDNDYRAKERIITPATVDGKNDFATFGNIVVGDVITIFDVTGRKIKQIRDTYIWDGTDDSGSLVESGLYIYQIKTTSRAKVICGTIVVAK